MFMPLCGFAAVAWGEAVQGLSVGLYFGKTSFSRVEPIHAVVVIKNNSPSTVGLMNSGLPTPTDVFQFVAVGTDGRDLPQKIGVAGGYSGAMHLLSPGKTVAYELNLRDFVEINNADELVVTARRLLSQSLLISSSNLVIRVTANLDSVPASDPLPEEVRQALAVRSPFGKRFGGPKTPSSTQTVESTTSETQEKNRPIPKPSTSSAFERNVGSKESREVAGTSLAGSKSTPNRTPLLASNPPINDKRPWDSGRKAGTVMAAILVALVLAILWRAAHRKPEA